MLSRNQAQNSVNYVTDTTTIWTGKDHYPPILETAVIWVAGKYIAFSVNFQKFPQELNRTRHRYNIMGTRGIVPPTKFAICRPNEKFQNFLSRLHP